jgi:hypothetical protein
VSDEVLQKPFVILPVSEVLRQNQEETTADGEMRHKDMEDGNDGNEQSTPELELPNWVIHNQSSVISRRSSACLAEAATSIQLAKARHRSSARLLVLVF